jgi:hypothetical protein
MWVMGVWSTGRAMVKWRAATQDCVVAVRGGWGEGREGGRGLTSTKRGCRVVRYDPSGGYRVTR